MSSTLIEKNGIVPVVTIHNAHEAVPIAEALLSGGISVIEVTFRTEEAEGGIRKIAEEVPDITIGAGTVRSVEQLETAVDAGAKFAVTPGFSRKVVAAAVKNHFPVYPGVLTPGEIETVAEYGISTVKFFPAEASGGTSMLKAFAGPYGDLRFIPTGGIGEDNYEEYLALKNVIAVGGSWITKPSKDGTFDYALIEERAARVRRRIEQLREA